MFERFTDRARRVVVLAQEEARKLNHNLLFKRNQFGGCRQGSHPSNYYSNI